MHATELTRNYTTRYCLFAIDSAEYLDMLPTTTEVGSGDLIDSTTCCAGSMARCVDGTRYTLTGDDEWVKYTGGGGGGGGGGGDDEDAEPIPDSDIDSLFG